MAIDFESIHKNFNGVMLGLCTACGGSCEKNQITLFLPGEMEFVAGKLGMDLRAFKEKFCNTIVFKGQHIFIMKAGVCPFLNASYHCELEDSNCKLTRCLLYPVIVSLVNGKAATRSTMVAARSISSGVGSGNAVPRTRRRCAGRGRRIGRHQRCPSGRTRRWPAG